MARNNFNLFYIYFLKFFYLVTRPVEVEDHEILVLVLR